MKGRRRPGGNRGGVSDLLAGGVTDENTLFDPAALHRRAETARRLPPCHDEPSRGDSDGLRDRDPAFDRCDTRAPVVLEVGRRSVWLRTTDHRRARAVLASVDSPCLFDKLRGCWCAPIGRAWDIHAAIGYDALILEVDR